MNRARLFLALAAGIVFLGIAVGAASYLSTTGVSAQTEGLPPSLDWMPESATLVGHLDVRSLRSSSVWESFSRDGKGLEAADEINERTGVDVFRDVDGLSFAFAEGDESRKRPRWGLVATGGFDSESVARRLGERDAEVEEYRGTRIYRVTDGRHHGELAAATAGDATLLLGEEGFLKEMIDAGGGRSARAKSLVEDFGEESVRGATFWAAGEPSPSVLSKLGGIGDAPPLESFVVSGRLDAELALRARGRARDADSARKLADVLRGLVALGQLRGESRRSELSRIAEGVSIELFESEIELGLRIPYDTLRRLAEAPAPKAAQ